MHLFPLEIGGILFQVTPNPPYGNEYRSQVCRKDLEGGHQEQVNPTAHISRYQSTFHIFLFL
jgi:hypothetical protein